MSFPFLTKGQSNNSPSLKDYSIKIWSNNEGLPSNNLSHIVKDAKGYLWISTFNGAVRFDGNEFKKFNTENIAELETSAIRSIQVLPDSSMYFSTESSGLLRYKKGIFTSYFKDSDLPRNILTTYLTPDGKLWIGTVDAGIYYVEQGVLHKYKIEGHEDMAILGFTLDSDNNLWVASSNTGVIKIGKDNYELFSKDQNFISSDVYSIEFYDGKLYVGTLRGLRIFSNGVWTEDERFRDLGVYRIIQDKNKNIWFGTTLGLARLDTSNSFEFLGVEDGLPARTINGIVIDEDNSLWLATYRGGLVQLKESSFKNITEKEGLSYNSINCIYQSSDGRIFIGNNEGKVDIVDDAKIQTLSINTDLSSSRIKDIFIENDGTIWVATYMGLLKKKYNKEKLFTKSDGLLSDRIRCISQSKDGSIWVGSRTGGINIISKDGKVKSIAKKEGLSSDFIFSIGRYSEDAMIATTGSGGLNIIYSDYKVDVINPNNMFSGVSIFNVYLESDNKMWLATNIGLFYYHDSQFYLINPEKGLAAETIFDIKEDEKGFLWMTSIKGLINVNKKEIIKLIEGKITKVNSELLNDSDGMITRECTGATKSLLSENGNIWIPTNAGITVFDPEKKKVVGSNNPSVFIENMLIDDTPIDIYADGNFDKKVKIEPGHRRYVFDFTTLSMNAPSKISFEYKLEGFDENWIFSGAQRHAKYTNLPYGDYTFKVIAINNNGLKSKQAAILRIEVIPFFYETTSFFILLIITFIGVIFIVYTLQTKRVNRRNRELEKLNAELDSFTYSVSHDLKAPLSSIQGLLNVARLDNDENSSMYYERIENSVVKLDSFIGEIIDYSKNARLNLIKEKVKMRSLIEGVIEGVSHLNEKKEIKFINEIDEDLEIVIDRTRMVFIANNLISNALKYADLEKDEPFVKIEAKINKNEFNFSVIDNGQGIEKKYQKYIYDMFYRANVNSTGSGLGLYIAKESATKLGGKIELFSDYKIGTTLVFSFPI